MNVFFIPVEETNEGKEEAGECAADYRERLNQQKRRKIVTDLCYMNRNFILGSVADVEWLWSIADSVLCGNRMKTTILLF